MCVRIHSFVSEVVINEMVSECFYSAVYPTKIGRVFNLLTAWPEFEASLMFQKVFFVLFCHDLTQASYQLDFVSPIYTCTMYF